MLPISLVLIAAFALLSLGKESCYEELKAHGGLWTGFSVSASRLILLWGFLYLLF